MAKPQTQSDAHRTDAPGSDRPDGYRGVLADLIEVEQRVQASVREAEAEAERAVARAEAEIEARGRAHDDALDEALRELRATLEAERTERVSEIDRRSDEAARRYRDVDDARVRRLAEHVARRIAEGEPGS
jgi:hypothetical protein